MKNILIVNASKRRIGNSYTLDILEKPEDLKAADEMVEWLLA